MKDNTIYMKLDQSVQVVNKKVTIGDIAQIQCSDYAVAKQINKIIALQVKGDKKPKESHFVTQADRTDPQANPRSTSCSDRRDGCCG